MESLHEGRIQRVPGEMKLDFFCSISFDVSDFLGVFVDQ